MEFDQRVHKPSKYVGRLPEILVRENGVCFLNLIRVGNFVLRRLLLVLCMAFAGCDDHPWNDPYPYEKGDANTLYTAFQERPKHLDPAQSYSEPEWVIIGHVYEPPLQYHYLKRPFILEPSTAVTMPEVKYFNQAGTPLNEESLSKDVAYTDYIIRIKPGIYYQSHPAFAKDASGNYYYHALSEKSAKKYQILRDFKQQGTRELLAEDYVYQIKRLAEPNIASPIFGLMSQHIMGLKELRETLMQSAVVSDGMEQDLRYVSLSGVEVLDKYTYRIRLIGKYPQFQYWLAMSFFCPIPWEVAKFYAQKGLQRHNISLDWYPVGTGAFQLTENNPDRRMILEKNPNFREERYPSEGMPEDMELGLLENAGKRLPMLDKIIFTLEKEDIPYWNKFLQGYYDISGISSDNFSSAIRLMEGGLALSDTLKNKGIRLQTSVAPGIWYWGFNMGDEIVGGYTEKARNLRHAIQLAFNVDEFISIFINGRGVHARGPIPPDIFGFATQPKVVVTDIEKAKALLKAAEISEGLTLYLDAAITGDPDEIAVHAWLQKQFQKIGIHLVIRGTDYNRYQEKLRLGTVQLYFAGWHGDYPDPENFLFLLYGPNSSAKFEGENWSNYSNPIFDKNFENIRSLQNSSERLQGIQDMVNVLEKDLPWIWGFYPKSYALYHGWVEARKPMSIGNNALKYVKIDPKLRAKQRLLWNSPIIWPFWTILSLLLVILVPAFILFWRKEHISLERV